jgi:hypothetical protein
MEIYCNMKNLPGIFPGRCRRSYVTEQGRCVKGALVSSNPKRGVAFADFSELHHLFVVLRPIVLYKTFNI